LWHPRSDIGESGIEHHHQDRTGNSHARRVLIEAARNHRFPARMSETLQRRQEGQPKAVREIAWRAQRPGYVGIRVMIPDSRAQGVCRPRVTA